MTIRFPQIYQQKAPTFSFEFFPPKTEAAQQRLRDNVTELKALGPTYVTCTYGAGGSTRQQTGQIVAELARELQVPAAAHLTCVGNSREQLIEVLEGFVVDEEGIRLDEMNQLFLVVTVSDPPTGQEESLPLTAAAAAAGSGG